jgi:hypothetical protein
MRFKEFYITERYVGDIGDLGHITSDIKSASKWFGEHFKDDPETQRIAKDIDNKHDQMEKALQMEEIRHKKRVAQLHVNVSGAKDTGRRTAIQNQMRTEDDIYHTNISRIRESFNKYAGQLKSNAYKSYMNKHKSEVVKKPNAIEKKNVNEPEKKQSTVQPHERGTTERPSGSAPVNKTVEKKPEVKKGPNQEWLKKQQEINAQKKAKQAKEGSSAQWASNKRIESEEKARNEQGLEKKTIAHPYLKGKLTSAIVNKEGKHHRFNDQTGKYEEIKGEAKAPSYQNVDMRKVKEEKAKEQKRQSEPTNITTSKHELEARKNQGIEAKTVPHPDIKGKLTTQYVNKEGKPHRYNEQSKKYEEIKGETKAPEYKSFNPHENDKKVVRPDVPVKIKDMSKDHTKQLLNHYNEHLHEAIKSGDQKKVTAIKKAVILMKKVNERKQKEEKDKPLKGKTIPAENKKNLKGKSILKTHQLREDISDRFSDYIIEQELKLIDRIIL